MSKYFTAIRNDGQKIRVAYSRATLDAKRAVENLQKRIDESRMKIFEENKELDRLLELRDYRVEELSTCEAVDQRDAERNAK